METLKEKIERLDKLLKKRVEISAEIRDLRYEIHYLESLRPYHKERDHRQSKAYQMFGKQYKDLNAEELKKYNCEAQKKYRNIGKNKD